MMHIYNCKNIYFTLRVLLILLSIMVLLATNVFGLVFGEIVAVQDTVIQETAEQDSLNKSLGESMPFLFSGNNQLNFGALVAKAFGYFVLVVALIFVSVYLIRKYVYNKREITSGNKAIQVLSTTYVGQKKIIIIS